MRLSIKLWNLQDLLKIIYLKELKNLNNLNFNNIESIKMMQFFLKILETFEDPWFHSLRIKFNYTNIDELLDIQHKQISLSAGNWMYEGQLDS